MKVWDALEFSKQEFPQPPWLIPGIIPGYGCLMLYAYGKVGKSILSVQLAHALSTQTGFLGVRPEKQFKVLYYQCDLPQSEWAYQLKELDTSPYSQRPLAEGWKTIWEEPGLLNVKERVERLGQIVKEGGYNLVIYDSLLSLTDGLMDLDKEDTIRKCLRRLRYISGPDNPMLVIHHKRKGIPGVGDHPSNSPAGSYAIAAGVSVLLDLRDAGIQGRGRFCRVEMELKRGPHGIWLPKTGADLYKMV